MKFTKNIFGTSKEILYNDDYAAFAHQISDEGITLDAENKKIVPAGTVIDADGKKASIVDGKSNAIGILLSDCDVTYGSRPGDLLYRAVLQGKKLPAPLTAEEQTALPQIKVMD